MIKKLTTRQEYDETKAIVEALIAEATEKGMLEFLRIFLFSSSTICSF